jgi:hypothetical protein
MSRAGQLQKLASFLENQGWASTFGRRVGPFCQRFLHPTSVPGNCQATTLIFGFRLSYVVVCLLPAAANNQNPPILVHASIPTMTMSIPIRTIVALPQQSTIPKKGKL